MSMFDYLASISIGSIAAELATDLNDDWWRPLTAMVTYGLLVTLVSVLTNKSLWFQKVVNGKALVLYKDGKLYRNAFTSARLDLSEFLALSRNSGYFSLSEISLAQLETTGQISFKPAETTRPATPQDLKVKPQESVEEVSVIVDGKLNKTALSSSGITKEKLLQQMYAIGVRSTKDVFYASVDSNGVANFYTK